MSGSSTLQVQHSSLQFSDTSEQQRRDIQDLFEKGTDFPIKTGTEAGPDPVSENANRKWLLQYADQFKHNIHFARDNWIAVDRSIIAPGSFKRGELFIADNGETWGHGHDTVLATVEFDHRDPRIGHIAQGAIHYPVRGARPGDVNYDINVRSAKMINNWMHKAAKGPALAFVNGDFNMPDTMTDWQFTGNWTSMADELKAWENTGHGPIDGFCSFDKDGRVSAKWFNVLNDKEFFQFSDHFVCRGAWEVKHRNV